MSKAKILKLKTEVTKMESVYSKSSTSDKTKAILKKAIDKAKGEIEKLEGKAAKKEPAKKEPKAAAEPKTRKKRKKATPLERLKSLVKRKKYSAYSKTGVDLEKDAGQPALPTGKRKSKSGKTYYEYRANRIDVKQPPKRYPKLAEGGETSDGKIRFDMYGYIHANDQKQDGDEIIRVSSYKEAEEKAEKYLKENKYELVELYRKDDFVGSIRTKKNFAYSSRYKKEDFADGGMMARGGEINVKGKSIKLKYVKRCCPSIKNDGTIGNYQYDFVDEMGNPFIGYGNSKEEALKSIEEYQNRFASGGYMADGGMMAKGGEIYKIQQKYKYDLQPKWEDEKFQTGGKYFLSFKEAQDFKKKLQGLSSSMEYKVVKVEEKMADGGNTYLNLSEDERMEVKNLKGLIEETMEAIEVHEKQAEKSDKKESKKYHESRVKDLKQVLENRKGRLARLTSRKMADGGQIKDQYDGREPEDIWNNLSRGQRSHFLFDHAEEIETRRGNGELSGKEISDTTKMEYSKLDKDIKNRFDNHVREGQYKSGGSLDIDSYADGGELKKDYLVTFDSQTQDFQPTTFQASSIYDLMETLRETVPAEVEILSIEQMTPHGVMEYGGVMGY